MKRIFLILALLFATHARAVSDPNEMLKDPAQEARAEQVGKLLRCLVCQNESIEESNATLAHDLRAIVRQRVAAGDSDQQIIDWMVARYGNFVRLSPPLTAGTILLWGMPGFAILAAAIAIFLASRSKPTPPAPLTPEERAQLEKLNHA